ncbi:importin-11 isoform X1, partial [Tanacetum coccineum]
MALSVSDLPAMYTLLSNSLSRDESVRKPAESNLAHFENMPGFCSCLMEVITANDLGVWYFVLTASDLEEWHQNPELFHHEQDAVLWSEKLRPCAEALYIVLFHNHSQLLGPVVVSILQEAMNGCPPSVTDITSGLLLKDDAYAPSVFSKIYYCFDIRYFVLTTSDLEEWHQNPELFHHEQDAILWSEKLRACAEALYIVLFHNHSQLLGLVVSILQEAMNGCPPSVTDITLGLLLKDAA